MRSGRHTVHTESLFGDGYVWFSLSICVFHGRCFGEERGGCFCIENKDESRVWIYVNSTAA